MTPVRSSIPPFVLISPLHKSKEMKGMKRTRKQYINYDCILPDNLCVNSIYLSILWQCHNSMAINIVKIAKRRKRERKRKRNKEQSTDNNITIPKILAIALTITHQSHHITSHHIMNHTIMPLLPFYLSHPIRFYLSLPKVEILQINLPHFLL